MQQNAVAVTQTQSYGIGEVSAHTAHDLLRQHQAILCDVRQPWEHELAKIPSTSIEAPLLLLRAFMGKTMMPEEREEAPVEAVVAAMPKILEMCNQARNQGLLLICMCRSGRRSLEAAEILLELGYPRVVSLGGGIEAWASAGYPVY